MNNKLSYDLPKKLAAQAMHEADNALYSDHCRGLFKDGDPNNPIYNSGWDYAQGKFVSLFGYKQDELLSKQY